MEPKVIIDGTEYVPKRKDKDQYQGLTDRELESRSLFDLDKRECFKAHEREYEWL